MTHKLDISPYEREGDLQTFKKVTNVALVIDVQRAMMTLKMVLT